MKRIALIAIVIENMNSTEKLNSVLHEYAEYILGRMGLPCRGRGISLISVAIDAPQEVISALSGKIGAISGVEAKTVYSKIKNISDGEGN